MVQEAWLRWNGRQVGSGVLARLPIDPPYAAVLERSRLRDRPSRRVAAIACRSQVDLEEGGIAQGWEALERKSQWHSSSVLQRQKSTPAERALLLLRDVFDFDPTLRLPRSSIRGEPKACRKLLERGVRTSQRRSGSLLRVTKRIGALLEEAFTQAATIEDVGALVAMLADGAVMITDLAVAKAGASRRSQSPRQPLYGNFFGGSPRCRRDRARSSGMDAEILLSSMGSPRSCSTTATPCGVASGDHGGSRIHRVFSMRMPRVIWPWPSCWRRGGS